MPRFCEEVTRLERHRANCYQAPCSVRDVASVLKRALVDEGEGIEVGVEEG